jgi:dTDP-4-dehydrorhamnose 3,5-epimerase
VKLRDTRLPGVVVVEQERLEDERGYFARTFDSALLEAHGFDGRVAQLSTSFNAAAGTLRGMHFQAPPDLEGKLVRCTRGAIFDVALDLRDGSPTRLRWHGEELSASNGRALYVPPGFAHGFQTLEPDSEVLYAMNVPFVPGAGRGVRWDDPAFGIAWPDAPAGGRVMSERDATYPDFEGS